MTLPAANEDIVGSWRAPETEGVQLGYYFYPDGVFILQDPRHKRFEMRGAWTLEEGRRLVISDVVDPNGTRSEAERELIRSERHIISITEMTPDSMVWKPEEAPAQVAFRRVGPLPRHEEKALWQRLLGL